MFASFKTIAIIFIFLLPLCASIAQGDDSGQYTIGPGDILEITVFDEEDLHKVVIVGPDGKIRFPLINEVILGGLSIRKSEKLIEDRLSEDFFVDPQVSIIVKEYNSQRVYVLGAVKTPGYYPLTGKTTLLEIISKAGGITEMGGKTIILVRGAVGKSLDIEKLIEKQGLSADPLRDLTRENGTGPIIIDGHKLLDKGDTTLNYILSGGDIVYIPNVQQVFVLGEVKRPGGIAYRPGMTLLQAITLAGGLTEMGRKKVLVKRVIDGKETKFKVKLNSIIKDSSKDVPLMPGDVIVVPRRIF